MKLPPKEKAKELVHTYINLLKQTDTCLSEKCENTLSCQHSWYYCEGWLSYAKQCAVKEVDGIFEFMRMDDEHSGTASNANSIWVNYYSQVKKEIELL
jgi:hypothetical protein